jgi:two-component system sensor histidine kinase/response regulator
VSTVGQSPVVDKQPPLRSHVLLAEDNPVNLRVAMKMLEKIGYRVDVALNGREAVEALSQAPFAAVLMDVQMPEMDGYEATKEIRRREKGSGRRTPVIAMTANALQGDREKALAAGMDDYLPKPVKRENLETILGRWTNQLTVETAADASPSNERYASSTVQQGQCESHLNQDMLERLRELGDPELSAQLIEDVSLRLASLRNAVEAQDVDSVEDIAHTLRSVS